MCISHCVFVSKLFSFCIFREGVFEFIFTLSVSFIRFCWCGINSSWFHFLHVFFWIVRIARKKNWQNKEGVCICLCVFFCMHDQWMNKSISLARHLMQNEILFLFFFFSISICWVCLWMSVCIIFVSFLVLL